MLPGWIKANRFYKFSFDVSITITVLCLLHSVLSRNLWNGYIAISWKSIKCLPPKTLCDNLLSVTNYFYGRNATTISTGGCKYSQLVKKQRFQQHVISQCCQIAANRIYSMFPKLMSQWKGLAKIWNRHSAIITTMYSHLTHKIR